MFNSAKMSNASADCLSGALFREFLHLGRVFCAQRVKVQSYTVETNNIV